MQLFPTLKVKGKHLFFAHLPNVFVLLLCEIPIKTLSY